MLKQPRHGIAAEEHDDAVQRAGLLVVKERIAANRHDDSRHDPGPQHDRADDSPKQTIAVFHEIRHHEAQQVLPEHRSDQEHERKLHGIEHVLIRKQLLVIVEPDELQILRRRARQRQIGKRIIHRHQHRPQKENREQRQRRPKQHRSRNHALDLLRNSQIPLGSETSIHDILPPCVGYAPL